MTLVAVQCSTPEGIGAEVGSKRPRLAGPTRLGAQRPRASERRSVTREWGQKFLFTCSTPEGIGAEVGGSRSRSRSAAGSSSAQRPRASERRSVAALFGCSPVWCFQCSTPEGIGAEVGSTDVASVGRSRPVVLNARGHRSGGRPPLSSRSLKICQAWLCSTPEGIGAEVGRAYEPVDELALWVLNARGHRSGGRSGRGRLRRRLPPRVLNARGHRSGGRPDRDPPRPVGPYLVLNARGHRSGGRSCTSTPALLSRGAQRPRASERRSDGLGP